MASPIALDGDGPLYEQIERSIARAIVGGGLPPGSRLPSEHELTASLGASRMTVHRAMTALAERGLIVRHRRRGTFVAPQRSEHPVMNVTDIAAEIAAQGKLHTMSLRRRRIRKCGKEEAARLEVLRGTPFLMLEVLHCADGQPLALECRSINLAAVPQAAQADFSSQTTTRWLFDQVPWPEARHVFRAVNATADIAEGLGLAEGDACLVLERRTWQDRVLITDVALIYAGSRHEFSARFSPHPPTQA